MSPYQALMYEPLLGALTKVFPNFPNQDFIPSIDALNKALDEETGFKYRFVEQDEFLPFKNLGYEERIYLHKLISTRQNNWHDFFNAQVWGLFPRIKSALNQIHFHEEKNQTSSQRSRRRDLLTLFDENGVFIKAPKSIKKLIKEHSWSELFCDKKEEWNKKNIEIITFGHALYEKYLDPYIGMTAHAIFVEDWDQIDEIFSKKVEEDLALVEKKELHPLPLLGIPNWHPNQTREFYANKHYFR